MNKADRRTIDAIVNGEEEKITCGNYVIRVNGEHVHVASAVNMFEKSFSNRISAAVWMARVIKASA
jgi:hypothetical protein